MLVIYEIYASQMVEFLNFCAPLLKFLATWLDCRVGGLSLRPVIPWVSFIGFFREVLNEYMLFISLPMESLKASMTGIRLN